MQGYSRPTIKLTWADDTEFAGLVVRVKRISIAGLLELDALVQSATTAENSTKKLNQIVARVAKMLRTWNLRDEVYDAGGNETSVEVPATEAGIRSQDPELLYAIVNAYTEALVGVSPPLPRPSIDGEQSPEASIPTETLSPSPPISDMPA